jgi:hypothetical protein
MKQLSKLKWNRQTLFLVALLTLASSLLFANPDLSKKVYQEYVVMHDLLGGDQTTKLSNADELLLKKVEDNNKNPTLKFSELIQIFQEADSATIVETALYGLPKAYPDLKKKEMVFLHQLSQNKSAQITSCLPLILAFYGYKESVASLISIINHPDKNSSQSAVFYLCYFGVESLSALPYLAERPFNDIDPHFRARITQNICKITFIGIGINFIPGAEIIRVPPNYSLSLPDGGRSKLPSITEIINRR